MKPWKIVETEALPRGGELQLVAHDTDWVIRVNGRDLMNSRQHASEEAMAEFIFPEGAVIPDDAKVLIGGLGMGFTLRAVLDRLGPDGKVVVGELSEAIVRWNRGPLADLAGAPLEDPRVRLEQTDVRELLRPSGRYHAILMDVDNGPRALSARTNASLYDENGLAACWSALRAGGTLVVWSAGPDERFRTRLERFGWDGVKARTVAAFRDGEKTGGRRHVLFIARRPLNPGPGRGRGR